MAKRYDAIITAARFTPDGKIDLVRIFERRGATYSDQVHISRETLVERLKAGKKIVVGQRKEYWASTFDFGKEVILLETGVISTQTGAGKDTLEGVLIF